MEDVMKRYEVLKPLTYKNDVIVSGEIQDNMISAELIERGILRELQTPDYDKMKKDELIKYAEENKIHIDEKATKEEIIKAINGAVTDD
jgi:hypothetical protein